ncbi:RNA-binding protein 33-like [Strongylocentrotus purpuratus]|uniref:RRM domain-containing protein n=1 Tax=Strongylocentrotus purpuratus TaxID=7668 RepID=A0A7M7T185_STRPU|nr:RNA-binding protein 33-like [Strongylocentrotus purpuratus]
MQYHEEMQSPPVQRTIIRGGDAPPPGPAPIKQRTVIPPGGQQQQPMFSNQGTSVAILGLSTSTSKERIGNLLRSVGPIMYLKVNQQQRKATAGYTNPEHAHIFQQRFHRQMIDLAHINVSLV